jgi:hypothetical protein
LGEEEKMTEARVDMSKVTPAALMRGEDEEETAGLKELLDEATAYLNGFRFHRGIKGAYLGMGVAKILGVFLFEITPAREDVDDKLWVVVGDLPPAYITTEESPNPATALDSYIGAMEEWVEAARAGRSVEGLIPVNVPPTAENAARLESRLRFLDEKILSDYAGDLQD